jgi:hypothetical protein
MTTTTNKTTTHTTSYRIVATTPYNGKEVVILQARSLPALFKRIEREVERFETANWTGWVLEDNSLGRGNWTWTLREHLRGMLNTGEIDWRVYRELQHYTD